MQYHQMSGYLFMAHFYCVLPLNSEKFIMSLLISTACGLNL